jgi:hypothetical protein
MMRLLGADEVANWLDVPTGIVVFALRGLADRIVEKSDGKVLLYFSPARIEHAITSGEIERLLDGTDVWP